MSHQAESRAHSPRSALLTRPWHGIGLVLCLVATAPVTAQRLNDTGQIICYDTSAATGTVGVDDNPEPAGFEGQDCTSGAAAADALGVYYKIGDSTVIGRDYSKIANDGSELAASATLGSGPSDWACTRDNVTGLIWEIKTTDRATLRYLNHTYTWYDTDPTVNGGDAGEINGLASCNFSMFPYGQCNTTDFRDRVNALTDAERLCGATDWRLPTDMELHSLMHYGASSSIDSTWFPNSVADRYWSGVNAWYPSGAWAVNFGDNRFINAQVSSEMYRVRLVRGGQ